MKQANSTPPGMGHMRMMGKRPELSDEQKAEKPEKGNGMMHRRGPRNHMKENNK